MALDEDVVEEAVATVHGTERAGGAHPLGERRAGELRPLGRC